jgi:hypothetical protein
MDPDSDPEGPKNIYIWILRLRIQIRIQIRNIEEKTIYAHLAPIILEGLDKAAEVGHHCGGKVFSYHLVLTCKYSISIGVADPG